VRVEHDEMVGGADEHPFEKRGGENAIFSGFRIEAASAGRCGKGDLHFLLHAQPHVAFRCECVDKLGLLADGAAAHRAVLCPCRSPALAIHVEQRYV